MHLEKKKRKKKECQSRTFPGAALMLLLALEGHAGDFEAFRYSEGRSKDWRLFWRYAISWAKTFASLAALVRGI
jgi:hypothetical protein